MIIDNLDTVSNRFGNGNLKSTSQCNGMFLNGFVSIDCLSRYLDHIILLLDNEDYLKLQKDEFDAVDSGYVFTEMRAFDEYKKCKIDTFARLYDLGLAQNLLLDDCITNVDGYNCFWSHREGEFLKDFFFEDGSFCVSRAGSKIKAVVVGCSFISLRAFQYFLLGLTGALAPGITLKQYMHVEFHVKVAKRVLVSLTKLLPRAHKLVSRLANNYN